MNRTSELYLSYLKLASLGMACAFVIFSVVAGVLLGDVRMIVGPFGVTFVVTVFARVAQKSSSVRLVWRALDESLKHTPKSGGSEAQTARKLNTKALRILLPLRRRVLSWSAPERMYVTGGLILSVSVPLFFLTLLLRPVEKYPEAMVGVLVGFGLFAGGALIEIIKVVLLIWKNTVGKFVLGLLAALVANISYVLARAEVNGITGMDPSKFTTAVATLSVILTPLIWLETVLIILALLFFVGYLVSMGYHYFKPLMFGQLILVVRNSVPYRFLLDKRVYRGKGRSAWLDMARLSGIVFLMVFTLLPTLYMGGSVRRRKGFFKRVFVETETYSFSRCANHHAGERVAFLDDGKILVAKPDGASSYNFEVRACE